MTREPDIRELEYGHEERAPVVTEEGTWGRVPPPYRPPEHRGGAGPAWWAGALFVLVSALWLGALSLSQLSSRPVAIPAIERGVAALTEVDALLSIHAQDLCRLAATDAPIDIPGFPVQGIDVQVDDIHCTDGKLDREGLRALLLSKSAEQVYLHGADAFLENSQSTGDISALSTSGAIRTTLNTVGASTHDRMTTAAWLLGAVSALLLAAMLLLGRGVRRVAGLGLALVIAATPMLVASLVLWAVLGTMDSGDSLTAQFAHITRSLLSVPLRNALVVAGAGMALIVPGLLVDRARRRSRHAEWWDYER